jgi:hypothetical protein
MRRPWTKEESERLLGLIGTGLSYRQMAELLGRSRSSTENRANFLLGKRNKLGRRCSDCDKAIPDANLSGRCKSCATIRSNKTPEMRKKRSEGWKKRLADPVLYARVCATAKANSRKAMADPVKRAEAAERGRKIYREYLDTPEMRARLASPEMLAQRGRSVSKHRMAWCPPEYRELYYELRRKIPGPANEARAAILDQAKADFAKLSPFERQMRALEKGAKLVANDSRPTFGEAVDYGESKWERLAG